MTEQLLFRLRVRYVKQGRLRYLGHLEVLHTIERVVRRAGLPYAVTQGFSPHMRAGFSAALPVGTASSCEWFDVFLTELVPVTEALERLRAAAPADLAPQEAGYVDVRADALTAFITCAEYRVALFPRRDAAGEAAALDAPRWKRRSRRSSPAGRSPTSAARSRRCSTSRGRSTRTRCARSQTAPSPSTSRPAWTTRAPCARRSSSPPSTLSSTEPPTTRSSPPASRTSPCSTTTR